RSRSLFTIGVSASKILRACSTVGFNPARSAASSTGTSWAMYVNGALPTSTWPCRVMRTISYAVFCLKKKKGIVYSRDVEVFRRALAHAAARKTRGQPDFEDADRKSLFFRALNHNSEEIP